jgi:exopolysaccharide production protein ExoQ
MSMSLTPHLDVEKQRAESLRSRRAERAIQLADTGLAALAFVALFAEDALRAVLGNAVGVALAALICVLYSFRLLKNWRKIRWMRMPVMLVLFLVASGIALLWSSDLNASLVAWAIQLATAGAAIGMTMLLPWPALVKALGTAVRWVLGLGLLVEAISLFVIQGPLWGLTGHLSMLSFAALVLIVIVPLQISDRTVWRGWSFVWVLLALGALVYTQSMQSWLALIATAVVRGLIAWTRATSPLKRRPIYVVGVGLLIGLVVALVMTWPEFTQASADGSWVALVSTSSTLAVVFFVAVLVTTYWRSWFVAVDRPQWDRDTERPFTASSMLPLLLMTALITAGAFDARLTTESGLLLVAICAVITKYPERLRGELR